MHNEAKLLASGNERGLIGTLLVTIIVLAGIAVGVYLILQRTNILPHASSNTESAAFSLTPNVDANNFNNKNTGSINVAVGEPFDLNLMMTNNVQPVSSFTVVINYPQDIVTVDAIDASSYSVLGVGWKEKSFDNQKGRIILSGQFANSPFKTDAVEPTLLTKIKFRSSGQASGQIGKIDFREDGTGMTGTDNTKLPKVVKEGIEVRVGLGAGEH